MEYIKAKHIVMRTKSSAWFGIDYNMNIYKGCCHGCIYCDSRSDCYGIEDFDTVKAKENALPIIRDDLRRKVRTGVVGTGAMSDPYNPFEKKLLLTRHALELLDAYGFGAAIATKSDLLLRDVDILQSIKEHSPVLCKVTITTADDHLCQKIEPHVTNSSGRFAMLHALAKAGIFAGILLMPVLPGLEDTEENIRLIVRKASGCGVKFIYPAFGMTLRQNQRAWYLSKLQTLFPQSGLAQWYQKTYPHAYTCTSPNARALWEVFCLECERTGILYKMPDIVSGYKQGYENAQLQFF